MKHYSRVYAQIDLDAIAFNIDQMKRNLTPGCKMMPVIKTDGYGHGASPIARMLQDKEYIWGFAVATLEEALLLRKAQIEKPILVLGCVFPEQYVEMLKNNIRACVYSEEMAEHISNVAVQENVTAHIHIKVDTGMNRLGFLANQQSVESIERITKMKKISAEGIFSHMARADEWNKTFTEKQIKTFQWMIDALKEQGVEFQHHHLANSASIIDVPDSYYDMVRAGIAMYGLYPSDEITKESVVLKPALSLKSRVIFVKEIEANMPVSYGGSFVSKQKMKIATVPVGYGDGYPRSLSNKGYVLVRGKKAPIVGRVCMDQFMVDVSDIDGVQFGDTVTLIGWDGDEHVSVEELSGLSDRFHYEFVCDLGKRIPRVFIRNGEIVGQMDYFA